MKYDFKPLPVDVPKEAPNNRSIVQAKFAIEQLTGAINKRSPDRAVRIGELLDTGLFNLNEAGILVPKNEVDAPILREGSNLFVNGDMRFHQRVYAMAQGSGTAFAADRWRRDNGNGAMALIRQPFANGQLDVPDNPRYYLNANVSVSSSADSYQRISQYIENVRQFSDREVLLSFWAKGAAGAKVAVEFQYFGTVYPPQAVGTVTLTTTWDRYLLRAKCPRITDPAIASSNHLKVGIWCSAGAAYAARVPGLGHQTGNFDFANFSLVDGVVDYPFEVRDDGTEFELCRRFYRKSYNLLDAPGQAATDSRGRIAYGMEGAKGGLVFGSALFGTAMRATPAVTVWPPDGTQTAGRVTQDDGSQLTATVRSISENGFELYTLNTAGRWGMWFQYEADAEP